MIYSIRTFVLEEKSFQSFLSTTCLSALALPRQVSGEAPAGAVPQLSWSFRCNQQRKMDQNGKATAMNGADNLGLSF